MDIDVAGKNTGHSKKTEYTKKKRDYETKKKTKQTKFFKQSVEEVFHNDGTSTKPEFFTLQFFSCVSFISPVP